METKDASKPFHRSVIGQLNAEQKQGCAGVRALGDLLLVTEIPTGHDEIIAAWERAAICFMIDPSRVTEAVQREKERCALLSAA